MEEVNDIYRTYYSSSHESKWINYINWVNETEAIDVINGLDVHENTRPMEINTKFIKFNGKYNISTILTNLFNSMFATGLIPSNWKTSFIVPIRKLSRYFVTINFLKNIKYNYFEDTGQTSGRIYSLVINMDFSGVKAPYLT